MVSSTQASLVGWSDQEPQGDFGSFLQSIIDHDNDAVKENLMMMVNTQERWDKATEGASGSGNSEAIRVLFEMEEFHPKASVLIEKAFAIPGLYPKCSALIQRALSNHHYDAALLFYSAEKCFDPQLPLTPISTVHHTEKVSELTAPLPIAIVEATKENNLQMLTFFLAVKKQEAASDKSPIADQLALAVSQSLLLASQNRHLGMIEALLNHKDIELNRVYLQAIDVAKNNRDRRINIKLLSHLKDRCSPETAEAIEIVIKELEDEEMRILQMALEHLRAQELERQRKAEEQRAAVYAQYRY